MALMGLFGKKRVTESFFVNSYGNDQTRGIYTFQVDIENGEILYKKHLKHPQTLSIALIMGALCVLHIKIEQVQVVMVEFVHMQQLLIF